ESSWSAESTERRSVGGAAEAGNAYARRSPGPIATMHIRATPARIARRLNGGGLRFMTVASALFEISYGARDRDGVRGRVDLTPSFSAIQSPPASRLSTRLLAKFLLWISELAEVASGFSRTS